MHVRAMSVCVYVCLHLPSVIPIVAKLAIHMLTTAPKVIAAITQHQLHAVHVSLHDIVFIAVNEGLVSVNKDV